MRTYIFVLILSMFPVFVQAQRRPQVNHEVKLEGAVNFRDLGGYVTTEFRRIKTGRIYRSAELSQLTDADMEELKRRKIYTVVDFRGKEEVENAPDRLLPGSDYLLLPAGNFTIPDLASYAKEFKSGKELMLAFYSDISFLKEKYQPFFRKLLALPDTSALVFHSTTGKDRTGIAAALFLYSMEIPMETILSDYVSTNIYRKDENEKIIDSLVKEQGMDDEMARQIMEANPAYLQATFNAIIRKYGTVDAFFYLGLGLGEEARYVLREKFLQ